MNTILGPGRWPQKVRSLRNIQVPVSSDEFNFEQLEIARLRFNFGHLKKL